MEARSKSLLEIRPEISKAKVNENTSAEESFQNLTLRPIIKFQNDLLVVVFKNYINKHKNVFYNLTIEKRLEYVENAIQKDIKLRNSLKGMVIGLFTEEEYALYILNPSSLNKRMMNIVKERLKNNLLHFEIQNSDI